jgi:hypothetical protein
MLTTIAAYGGSHTHQYIARCLKPLNLGISDATIKWRSRSKNAI